jgi:hypothetical protein
MVKEDIHWCPPCEKPFTHAYVDFVLNGWFLVGLWQSYLIKKGTKPYQTLILYF